MDYKDIPDGWDSMQHWMFGVHKATIQTCAFEHVYWKFMVCNLMHLTLRSMALTNHKFPQICPSTDCTLFKSQQ